MQTGFDLSLARDFGTALLLGALIGVEREKRNQREGSGIAGVRSFVLLAQVGAIGGYFALMLSTPWPLVAAVLVSGVTLTAANVAVRRARPEHIGVTTELAAIATVLLGALATTGHREVAVGLGVATAVVLAYKQPLHGLVGKLGWDDVLIVLRFLSAAFIVLPLLPDRAIDPWHSINPYTLWLLVLLISGLSLVGYVATRWLGPGRGIAVTAATGGLVSSTAVTLAMVKQSREEGASPRQLAGGVLLAWGVMFVRVLVTATVVDSGLLRPMLAPFGAMALACAASAGLCLWRCRDSASSPVQRVPLQNPFSLLAAGKFAALFALVQLLLGIGREHFPGTGVYVIAALAGLTDVDAITLSMAERAHEGADATRLAVQAIVVATAANTLVKAALAAVLGRSLARPIAIGTAAVFAVGALALGFA